MIRFNKRFDEEGNKEISISKPKQVILFKIAKNK